jgi:transcriptional regulator with XRE-family HTH domain
MNPELELEVRNLRALNLTPKQIARKLGLRPSEVTTIIQNQATQSSLGKKPQLAPLFKCLANKTMINDLLPEYEVSNNDEDLDLDGGNGGLGLVIVARSVSNRFQFCSYLVDYWCLGVKDAIGPRQVDRYKYEQFRQHAYGMYPEGYSEITLQQAQDIIFGSIEYAAKLGLKPHPDFAATKDHLGEWNHKTELEFGCDGKPFFMAGPYDNVNKIMRTLTQTVGTHNFEFMTPIDGNGYGEPDR